jgi:DNA helicase HerA-like ATPase
MAQDAAKLLARCKICDVNSGVHRLDPASEIAARGAAQDDMVCAIHRSEPLDLFCGTCRQPLSSHALLGDRSVVAILGGVGSGKTSLLWVLRDRLRSSNGVPVKIRQPLGDTDQQLDQAVADLFTTGRASATPVTDAVIRNYAWELVTTTKPRESALMAFHDAAGEVWQKLEQLPRERNARFYRYLDLVEGIIFLIDGQRLAETLAEGGHRRAVADPAAAQEIAILDAIDRRFGARAGEIPVAVTISKADVLWNDERWSAFKPDSGAPREAIQAAVRELLTLTGRGDMIEELESVFSAVTYFALSAFGRDVPAEQPLSLDDVNPVRVEEPLLSLIVE